VSNDDQSSHNERFTCRACAGSPWCLLWFTCESGGFRISYPKAGPTTRSKPMSTELWIGIIGIFVAVVIGAWQIYSTYQKRQSNTAPKKSENKTQTQVLTASEGSTISKVGPVGDQENIRVLNNSDNKIVSKLTPKEIISEVSEAPPSQEEMVTKSYYGIRVSWVGSYVSIWPEEGKEDIYYVSLRYGDTYSLVGIEFRIDINVYPYLKIAKQGQEIRVTGTIARYYPFTFTLENCTLQALS
jgi:hypothetical protein